MKFPFVKKEDEENETHTIDDEINYVLRKLGEDMVNKEGEEDYRRHLEYLERLTDIKQKQRLVIHPDALVGAAATFLGILVIMGYERGHVIATKAFSLLPKIRL